MENILIERDEVVALRTDLETLQLRFSHIVKSAKYEHKATKALLPEVFISSEEACRLLGVTNKTLNSIVATQMLDVAKDRSGKRDRFLLSELIWLQNQPYRNASKNMVNRIVAAKRIFNQKA